MNKMVETVTKYDGKYQKGITLGTGQQLKMVEDVSAFMDVFFCPKSYELQCSDRHKELSDDAVACGNLDETQQAVLASRYVLAVQGIYNKC